ncbi:MAG TPA: DedA family protein [Terriglobales bacterium]|nr:DedA family protein [Terriglobales bacterium]
MDTVETLLRSYGLLGLFFACAVEGDVSLLVAGLLVHLGLFGGAETFLIAVAGLITPDLLMYWLGRRTSRNNWASQKAPNVLNRAGRMLDRFGALSLPVVRLFYGIRNATCFLCGHRKWRFLRFLAGDLLSAGIWAALLIGVGFLFASSIDSAFGHVRRVEQWLFVGAITALIVYFTWRDVRRALLNRRALWYM